MEMPAKLFLDLNSLRTIKVTAHYAKLMNLPVATFKSASWRSLYDTTEKHLRCLHSLGQDDNQMQVLSMMQKFHGACW